MRSTVLHLTGVFLSLAAQLSAAPAASAPRLFFAFENGVGLEAAWSTERQATTLAPLGYRGPVGLQCYAIPGEPEALLTRSIGAWHRLTTAP